MRKLQMLLILTIICLKSFGQQTNTVEAFSFSSCYVEMHHENKYIGNGTGFFFEINSKLYFLTNNHIVSGEYARREYFQIHKHPIPADSIANNLKIRLYRSKLNEFKFVTLPLIKGVDSTYIKMWEDDPSNKTLMDIVAIPVPDSIKTQLGATRILNETNLNPNILLAPSSELFIVGFPLNYASISLFPLWKKGSIASEPALLGINNSSYYIDALTMGGMSGSPVYFRGSMSNNIGGGTDMYAGMATFLLGIYSAQNYQIGLGLVWRLDKVINKLKSL